MPCAKIDFERDKCVGNVALHCLGGLSSTGLAMLCDYHYRVDCSILIAGVFGVDEVTSPGTPVTRTPLALTPTPLCKALTSDSTRSARTLQEVKLGAPALDPGARRKRRVSPREEGPAPKSFCKIRRIHPSELHASNKAICGVIT